MRTTSILASLILASVLSAAPVPKEKAKPKDEDAILGSWKIEKFDTGDGTAPPQKSLETVRFEFKQDAKFVFVDGRGNQKGGEFKIDPNAKMKSIDMTLEQKTLKAIYVLDGDTLKICMAQDEKVERPEEFAADSTRRLALITFKRVVDEKKDK